MEVVDVLGLMAYPSTKPARWSHQDRAIAHLEPRG